MNRSSLFSLLLVTCLLSATNMLADVSINSRHIDGDNYSIELNIQPPEKSLIYHDFITISTDHPDVQLGQWQSNVSPKQQYDPQFKETKLLYAQPIILTIPVRIKKQPLNDAHLHLTYLTTASPNVQKHLIPLRFARTHAQKDNQQAVKTAAIAPEGQDEPEEQENSSWHTYLEKIISTSQSLWIRLLLIFLLGILMSLTPCIYPMVPITVGILQSHKNSSTLYNFIVAFAYTLGIATTFAFCGLFAAVTGSVCGKFLMSPIFVILLVILLAYLGLSMFGLYEMYTPKFLNNGQSFATKGGSLLSAFLFGAASGTVASPCLSPGLALLLSIVATLGSRLLGFTFLFVFGIGLSVPLLLIGTFSSSLEKLPKAGMWMIEVKKIFGFLLFGMCLYYLNNILPWYIMLWLMALFALAAGIYYLRDAEKTNSKAGKTIKNLVGISLCAGSIILAIFGYQEKYVFSNQKDLSCQIDGNWYIDYQKAVICARGSNKKLFIDFWATFCSICKAIDKKMFQDPEFLNELAHHAVLLKVDGSDQESEPFATLHKKYTLIGFPTYLLIDPATGTVIKKWGSELYATTKQKFIKEIEYYTGSTKRKTM